MLGSLVKACAKKEIRFCFWDSELSSTIQGILGIGNYYHRFVKDFSQKVQPPIELNKKNNPFRLT